MNVITRFAPSPTGSLHIGGARTALFNYLYAKHKGGKFLLRIEDTDKTRSTPENTKIIYDSLKWLQIDWDDEVIIQSEREERHKKIAHQLLKEDKAYYCYYSKEELEFIRQNRQEKDFFYNKWRDKHETPPKDIEPVIRIKSPQNGTMIINDVIQGKIKVDCADIDDFVILRSDGTPTYMLAVVVDDHDMGITHIIRGADHLTNAGRQNVIYESLNWKIPSYTHIPLIHSENGAKLSKRHGALGVEAYKDMGYLPEAICNYLLRLGWSHGNDEVISKQEAIEWFDIRDIGKSAARIDFKKLDYLNAHYIKIKPTNELLKSLKPFISNKNLKISKEDSEILEKGLEILKIRAKTLKDITEQGMFFLVEAEKLLTENSIKLLDKKNEELLNFFIKNFENHIDWNKESIMEKVKEISEVNSIKLNELMQILRISLTGSITSPSIIEIMEIFGKNLTLTRLKNFSKKAFKLNDLPGFDK